MLRVEIMVESLSCALATAAKASAYWNAWLRKKIEDPEIVWTEGVPRSTIYDISLY